jgi:hypothetical protein
MTNFERRLAALAIFAGALGLLVPLSAPAEAVSADKPAQAAPAPNAEASPPPGAKAKPAPNKKKAKLKNFLPVSRMGGY